MLSMEVSQGATFKRSTPTETHQGAALRELPSNEPQSHTKTRLRILAATWNPKVVTFVNGNDHEPWTNLGSSSDNARRRTATHCGGRQASVWLLHGAPASHHDWRSLLGMDTVQSRPARLDVDIYHSCASFEPVLPDTYAPRGLATNRSVSGHFRDRMVGILALP